MSVVAFVVSVDPVAWNGLWVVLTWFSVLALAAFLPKRIAVGALVAALVAFLVVRGVEAVYIPYDCEFWWWDPSCWRW